MDTTQHYDLAVVGAGILGLAHAYAAHQRGLRVVVLDRDHHLVGASVRNFGHASITAQEGELLELGRAGRARWLEVAGATGIYAAAAGTLVVARTAAERALVEELHAARGDDEVELLDPAAMAARLAHEEGAPGASHGGAFLPADLRVDPREAAPAIARWLEGQGVEFRWATSVLGLGDGVVRTTRGDLRADRTVVCVGHDIDYLLPDVAAEGAVERCTLAVVTVDAPRGFAAQAGILTSTSMTRYDAFTSQPSAAAVRTEVEGRAPELLEIGANVMMTWRPDGSLVVGDTHEYGPSADPFVSERAIALVLEEAAAVLGVDALRVRDRWQGVYASSPRQPVLVRTPMPDVTVVSVTTGVGMTTSFGLGERTVAAWGA
ncbi:TIGR03364 family FAD-dependent oxidoreductase [Demequina pelophila]|uniref:TIGR03364 family FAD-dependent oxidoreductase n=1 Tax=Demequina pelophila TaxID=1638984 RepID=UPI0007813CFE|nr:TIGR03364 family FAD-dependent oxidoreductase [Demequina pelophila]